ncbi:MAG: hypothetical protein QOJ64_2132 [Acidobacteriota bacterium]|jgi:hypothetical protein|nr:hypothetical protein [Acidobacteriota bacterium]
MVGDKLQNIAESSVRQFTQQPKYLSVKPATWEALTRHYFAEELASRDEVDSAARSIAADSGVPSDISNDARYYLLLRIQCAHDFLGMVFPPQSDSSPFSDIPESLTDRQATEWLLVNLWVRRFDHWLKITAAGVAGPFAFYGIDPADSDLET